MNSEQPVAARSCILQAAVFFPTSLYFESSLPVACHPLMPGEVVLNSDSYLKHVIRSGYVVMPCAEAEKFTLGELREMIVIARRERDRWMQP